MGKDIGIAEQSFLKLANDNLFVTDIGKQAFKRASEEKIKLVEE